MDMRRNFRLARNVLDQAMPMHLILDGYGVIEQVGPTLQKLRPAKMVGADFRDHFSLRHPVPHHDDFAELRGSLGKRIKLEFRDAPETRFRGIALPLPDDGYLLNLSFGISALSAVDTYKLSNSDFAPTDPTIDMLFLQEAKSVIVGEFRRLNDRLEQSRDKERLAATRDALTGLANRRAFEGYMERMRRTDRNYAIMHIDLDLFKEVNDTLGHAAGDAVLKHVAACLEGSARSGDRAARIGGDEFVLLLADINRPGKMARFARRVIAAIEQPIPFEDQTCQVSASIGYSWSALYEEPDPVQILADADVALYAAKRAGRGRAVAFEPAPTAQDRTAD